MILYSILLWVYASQTPVMGIHAQYFPFVYIVQPNIEPTRLCFWPAPFFATHIHRVCVFVRLVLGQTIGVYVIGRDVARRSPPATRAPVPQKVIPSRYMNVWTMQALK